MKEGQKIGKNKQNIGKKTREKQRQHQRKYREKTTKKKSLHAHESEAEIIENKKRKTKAI